MSKADDVWKVARFIWENTDKITDRDLVKQLEESHGEYAPKSSGSISKRRNKEGWVKNKLIKITKNSEKVESRGGGSQEKRESRRTGIKTCFHQN